MSLWAQWLQKGFQPHIYLKLYTRKVINFYANIGSLLLFLAVMVDI